MKISYIFCCFVLLFMATTCRSIPDPAEAPITGEEAAEITEEDDSEPELEYELLPVDASLPVSSFGEIWAYLLPDRPQTLKTAFPISDVGFFGAEVDAYGTLVNVPNRRAISFYNGRVHLVVGCSGRALTHFSLKEGSSERKQLIEDLLKATEAFDGLQIDFENVGARDGDAYLSFLRELRAGLKNKMFTVALAARTRAVQNDVYDYKKILPYVDRILVMAYDEHWSTSAPGPIASMGWSQRVAAYSLDVIGKEKLIMGLPFYGRSWGDYSANRAFLHSGIERLYKENGSPEVKRESGIPTFRYQMPLNVTVYYEDAYSLSSRLDMYKKMGVASVGFWCLGQETPAIWSQMKLER